MDLFCVYLTIYYGLKMPRYYIGSSSVAKVKSGYHGSVKSKKYKSIWEQELNHYPELFCTYILVTTDTRKGALEHELRLQLKLDVVRSPNYINMAVAAPNGFFGMDNTGSSNSQYGKSPSIETRLKLREANLGTRNPMFGKKHSDEIRTKISISQLGKAKPQRVVECNYCGRNGGISNMYRYHFANCKYKD